MKTWKAKVKVCKVYEVEIEASDYKGAYDLAKRRPESQLGQEIYIERHREIDVHETVKRKG